MILDAEKKRIMATLRSASMPHPLRWEFPGGKVRSAETPEESILREIREELGVEVQVLRPMDAVIHHYGQGPVRLIPFLCSLQDGKDTAQIILSEHAEWRWLSADELEQVDWLEADLGVVDQVRKIL